MTEDAARPPETGAVTEESAIDASVRDAAAPEEAEAPAESVDAEAAVEAVAEQAVRVASDFLAVELERVEARIARAASEPAVAEAAAPRSGAPDPSPEASPTAGDATGSEVAPTPPTDSADPSLDAAPPIAAAATEDAEAGIVATLEQIEQQAPGPTASDGTIRDLDEALASDVDDLLDGCFQSVREVLEDAFDHEEQAAASSATDGAIGAGLQADDDGPEPVAEESCRSADAGEPAESAEAIAAEACVEEPEPAPADPAREAAAQTTDPADTPAEPASDSSEVVPVADVAPVEEESAEVVAGSPGAVAEAHDDLGEFEIASVDDPGLSTAAPPAVETPVAAAPARRSQPEEDPPEAAEPAKEPGAVGRLLARIGPPVVQAIVAALSVMNMPLRHVPPGLRPVVDWIALSLLIWIPLVWMAAIFLV